MVLLRILRLVNGNVYIVNRPICIFQISDTRTVHTLPIPFERAITLVGIGHVLASVVPCWVVLEALRGFTPSTEYQFFQAH